MQDSANISMLDKEIDKNQDIVSGKVVMIMFQFLNWKLYIMIFSCGIKENIRDLKFF